MYVSMCFSSNLLVPKEETQAIVSAHSIVFNFFHRVGYWIM
jgi:hypothetical protein